MLSSQIDDRRDRFRWWPWNQVDWRKGQKTGRASQLFEKSGITSDNPWNSRRKNKHRRDGLATTLSFHIILPNRTHNRSRSPRWTASGLWKNVGKGSRQIRSVTSEKGLALRVETGVWFGGSSNRFKRPDPLWQPSKNCHGQGESDCLIKTKHCDGRQTILTQCDFCPVLWMSKWRDSTKRGLTAGVTMTLLR